MYEYTIKNYIEVFKDDSYLFHTSLLTKDRSKIDENFFKSSKVIDISFLSTERIINLLHELKVTHVTFFTYQSKFDLFLYSICMILKIAVYFHDHGIVTGNAPGKGSLRFTNLPVIFSSFFSRHLFLFIRFYDIKRKLRVASLSIEEKKMILSVLKGNYNSIKFHGALVFCDNNFEVYNRILDFSDTSCCIGGVPVFLNSRMKSTPTRMTKIKSKILYIHQPFSKFGFTRNSLFEDIEYIKSINKQVKYFGFQLFVRLHPTEDFSFYYKALVKDDVIISNEAFIDLDCSTSEYILGHWSTALLTGVVLGVPILVLKYPKLYKKYIHFNYLFEHFSFNGEVSEKFALPDLSNSSHLPKVDPIHFIGRENTFEFNYELLKRLWIYDILQST